MASILVIDDSESHRADIRRAIHSSGLFERVFEAADGIRGLRLLMSENPDLVLCDLEMPGLDGEKLLRVKASTPGRENLPFLFLTGSADVEQRARLLELGASDAIVKPYHRAELVARLALHLKVKRLQDELRVKNATLGRLSTLDELIAYANEHPGDLYTSIGNGGHAPTAAVWLSGSCRCYRECRSTNRTPDGSAESSDGRRDATCRCRSWRSLVF